MNEGSNEVALVIGAGPGLGAGLARQFAGAGIAAPGLTSWTCVPLSSAGSERHLTPGRPKI